MLKRFLILLLITGFAAVLAVAQDIPVKRSSIVEQYKGKPYYLHFVKQGETLFAISKAYGVEVEEIVADNPGVEKALHADQVLRIPYRQEDAVKPETKPQTQVVQPELKNPSSGETVYIDHFVSKKETLYGISKQYGVTVDDLIKANPSMTELKNGMVLKVPLIKKSAVAAQQPEVKVTVPEKLQIPDDGLLTVKQGQTIYSITKQYGIADEELLRLNPELSDGLKTGQTIRLKESALPLQTKTEPSTITVKTSEEEPVTINRSFEPCQPLKNNSTIYEVALLLPLNLEQADSIISVPLDNLKELKSYKTFDYFQLYAGVMMATDTLEKEGCRVNLHIYDADSESDTLKVKRVLKKSEMAQMDLIIGPVFARSFTIASRFAAQHNIPIVNALSRRSAIIDNNPTVYKIYPGEGAIANALATYILKHQPEANIIVVRNTVAENELMVNAFADSVKGHSGASLHYAEVIYQKDGFAAVNKAMDGKRKNIIILFSNNRSLVPSFVSKLNAYARTSDIMLFGIPGWEDIEIETEFLLALDYHQVVPSAIDYNEKATRNFILKFREKYGVQPLAEKAAYLGYDITMYFMNALKLFGKDFRDCLTGYNHPGIESDFMFRKPDAAGGFENTSAGIMHFDDYRWVEDK